MRRRDLLKGASASLAALAAPRIGRAEKAHKLVFVPPVDLTVLDPVVTAIRSTRNHAYLVFDTLYGIDTSWMAQPQMVAGHQVDEDGLIWTLTLRDRAPAAPDAYWSRQDRHRQSANRLA